MSFRLNPNGLLIQDGMILSNEPGYYEDGNFGIRIESLMVAKKVRVARAALSSCFVRLRLTVNLVRRWLRTGEAHHEPAEEGLLRV